MQGLTARLSSPPTPRALPVAIIPSALASPPEVVMLPRLTCAAAAALLGFLAAPAVATYLAADLVDVPVERLVKNLEAKATKEPKDVTVRLNLARAHGMAYASKTDTAKVWKDKEAEGVWFDHEPKLVPFELKKTDDKKKAAAAKAHLKKAKAWFDEALKLDKNNLSAQLGRAWVLEQSGEKKEAIAGYRATIKQAWAKEKDLKAGRLGGRYYTAEAAEYLVLLLDKEKDRKEIAELKERSDKLEKLPRPITPLVVPLQDGLTAADLIDGKARVAFDADGSGRARRWTWVTPKAGWLVSDPRGTGQVTSGLQLFGNVTFWMFWEDGYQALSALDDDGDGVLKGKELAGLAIWQDANGNGKCDRGEVRPLADHGVVALSCRPDRGAPAGCAAGAGAVVKFKNGKTRPTFDVVLQRR